MSGVLFDELYALIENSGVGSFYPIMGTLPYDLTDKILAYLPAMESMYFFTKRIEWEQRTNRRTGEKKILRVAEWAEIEKRYKEAQEKKEKKS